MTEVLDLIAAWLESSPVLPEGVTVVIEPANAPAPEGEYVTLSLLSSLPEAYPLREVESAEDGEATVNVETFKTVVVQFNAYMENGESFLEDLLSELYLPEVPSTIAIRDFGDIRNLTFLEDTAYVPRYQRDLTFATSHEYTRVLPYQQTVYVSGDIEGPVTVGTLPD